MTTPSILHEEEIIATTIAMAMEDNDQSDCNITGILPPNEAANAKRKSNTTEPECGKKKPFRQPREIVESGQLSTLISSYNVHFAKYSEGRSKVIQVIPSAVWKLVYQDYLKAFPNSTIKEFNLKDRVRETLAKLETENSNEKNSQTAALQSSSVLEELKLTDSHAKRNILSHRSKLMDPTAKKTISEGLSSPIIESDGSHSSDISVRKSKHTMLSEQVNAITLISESLQNSASTRSKFAAAKLNQIELKSLKELRDLGVITEDEFCSKARHLFQI